MTLESFAENGAAASRASAPATHDNDVHFDAPPALEPRRRLRVLFINDTARNGGPGRSLYSILKFLDPKVVHRAVVLPRPGPISELLEKGLACDDLLFEPNLVENPIEPWDRPMMREDFDAPLPLRAARLGGNVLKATYALARLRSVIQRAQFDLIYCNGTNADFAGGALARMTGVPALWHVRYTAIPKAVRPVHTRLSAHASVARIVCVSKAAAKLFPHCEEKVRVINNALDTEEFAPGAVTPTLREELGFPDDAIVFGSHGRILPRKGYVEMTRAARIALDRMSPEERRRVRFVVVGDTPEDIRPDHLAECRELVRALGVTEHVHFVGFRSDVKPYVAGFDVAVVPSVYPDPLPRAVIESMAFAKPVVAFDVGGVAEMLEDGATGALVSGTPPDVDGLANAMLRYARDPGMRASHGLAARLRIERRFDARAHARRIQNEIVSAAGV
jgi:glycosyltransferase involved in cell wall biosynthesis